MNHDDDKATQASELGPQPEGAGLDAFYDGDCPICAHEVDWLRRHALAGRIRFFDISAADFDAGHDAGMPIDRLVDCIQVRLESGDVLEGAAALRHLYEVTRAEHAGVKSLPVISPMVEAGFRVLTERRLRRVCQRISDSCVCLRRVN